MGLIMVSLKYWRKRGLVCKKQMTVFFFTKILESSDVHRVVFASTWQTSNQAWKKESSN